jgi:hypothetical protein
MPRSAIAVAEPWPVALPAYWRTQSNAADRQAGKLAHAAKVIALCLPPVVMSLIGLAAQSRKKGGTVAGRKISPGVRSKRPLRASP